ncbi:MAG: hydrolase [Candidatus Saccharibacteria bacterium]
MITTQPQECCPRFDPAPWDDKVFQWENKKFIKDKVFTLFHIPINFGQVITRMINKVDKAGVQSPEWLCLSDHTSKWKMDIYLAVDKEVPEANNVTLSGRFFSKVYEGNFKETGNWCKDYEQVAKGKGYSIYKWYMWYTTCPKCAKKYGKNYVAVIAEVR